jgi:hypothetical protein
MDTGEPSSMIRRLKFLVFVLACVPVSANAWLPPPSPPKADALAAARQLLKELPVVESLDSRRGIQRRLSSIAEEWLVKAHPDSVLPDLKQIFLLKVEEEVLRALPPAIAGATENLATTYAYRLPAHVLSATADFFATTSGRAYAAMMVDNDEQIASLIVDQLRQNLSPRFEAILVDSQTSFALMKAVNSRR